MAKAVRQTCASRAQQLIVGLKIKPDVFDTYRRDEYRVAARHLIWFILRREGHSWKEIAWETLGTIHHSSVLKAVQDLSPVGHEEELDKLSRLEPPTGSLVDLWKALKSTRDNDL